MISMCQNYVKYLYKRLKTNLQQKELKDFNSGLTEWKFDSHPYWFNCLSEESSTKLIRMYILTDLHSILDFITIHLLSDLAIIIAEYYIDNYCVLPTLYVGQTLTFSNCKCEDTQTELNEYGYYNSTAFPYQLMYINSHLWSCTIEGFQFCFLTGEILVKIENFNFLFRPIDLHDISLQIQQKKGCRLLQGRMITPY